MEKFLKAARAQSKKSEKPIKIGAILVRKGKILNKAHNTNKSHPFQKKLNLLRFWDEDFEICSHTQHAEFKCLYPYFKNKKDVSNCTLFVYRENSKGEVGNCKPCPACSWLINQLEIKRIVYINDSHKIVSYEN